MHAEPVGKQFWSDRRSGLNRYAAPDAHRDQREHVRISGPSDAQPRSSSGQPAQSTTGVEKARPIQLQTHVDAAAQAHAEHHVAHGQHEHGETERSPDHIRRVMSASSGFGASSSVMVRGSRAMPQIGQAPGASRTTSGCIGQV